MFAYDLHNQLLKKLLLAILLVAYISFSYNFFNGWWYSSLGTVLIIVFSYFIWGKKNLEVTGLKILPRSVLFILIVILLTVSGSYLLISFISSVNNLAFTQGNFFSYYHIFFYTLNEEIILGGIVIYFLYRKLKINPFSVSAGLAIVFVVIHYIFYRWIVLCPGLLTISTLSSLFFIGILRNNLIITSGHIGYAWAIHFGWMVVMFGIYHYHDQTEEALTEPEVFNYFLGSAEMLIISFLLALSSTLFLIRNINTIKEKLVHKSGFY